jgi:hypothetical protein
VVEVVDAEATLASRGNGEEKEEASPLVARGDGEVGGMVDGCT